jgi:hypothetical protein
MGLKTDNSFIDAWLSKKEATIENIVSLTTIGNFTVNQLIKRKAIMVVIAKVVSAEEPK